jgi:probable F420-dependent oxidoreductase
MDFGVAYVPAFDAIGPADIAALAEAHGQGSLFFAEHTHIPVASLADFPGGGEIPAKYQRCHDPFVALTAAALATERIRVGTGICLVVERDPIVTAKAVASLDQLSGGRFDFGVGTGWNRLELANHGVDPGVRMRVFGERVEAMKAIWTREEAEFHGEFVDFDPIRSWPKPAQAPHPPVLVGGHGARVLDRVLAHGDGWFPNWGRLGEGLFERMDELRARAERPLEVAVIGVPADPAVLERLRAAGVDRAVHWVPTSARDEVERALAVWAAATG